MHPKIKNRPAAATAVASPVRPLMLHDVTNRQTPASAASLRRLTEAGQAMRPAPVAAISPSASSQ